VVPRRFGAMRASGAKQAAWREQVEREPRLRLANLAARTLHVSMTNFVRGVAPLVLAFARAMDAVRQIETAELERTVFPAVAVDLDPSARTSGKVAPGNEPSVVLGGAAIACDNEH
jgi:hypothetical protein